MFLQDHKCLLWKESGFQIKRKSGILKTKNDRIDAYRKAEYALFNRHNLKITPDYAENIFVLHDLLVNKNRIIDCIKKIQVPLKELEKHSNQKSINDGFHVNFYSHKQLKGIFHIAVMAAIWFNPQMKKYLTMRKKKAKKVL